MIKALVLVLRLNIVGFNSKAYQQINGTAMGTSLGPPYANLFMEMIETPIVKRYSKNGLLLYKRFIDDIFAIFEGTESQALDFIKALNNAEPGIKLTHTCSLTSVDFLDITIQKGFRYKKEKKFDIKVYQKKMNQYLYLPFNSYHTPKQKLGFIKGESIRYARISSNKKDYLALLELFQQRLKRRGYQARDILNSISQVDWHNRKTYLKVKPKDKSIVPFIFKIEHNPRINHAALRNLLNQTMEDLEKIRGMPNSLKGHITICYKLPARMHALVLKARAKKGF
jgi:hypothetical protein